MKKFRFPLDRLRNWRQSCFEAEQARLQALVAEQRRVQAQRDALILEMDASVNRLAECGSACAEELIALNSFCLYAQHEARRLDQSQKHLGRDIEKQREKLLAARRDVEVLDQLRERRLQQWRAEAGREQEDLVAELVVARWKAAGR